MVAAKKKRPDWEAIERDFRTGKFSLRELEAKHNTSYANISRKAKEKSWKKDLRERIKQETDAALLQESVTEQQKSVTETVAVAVEINLQVIRSHKGMLSDLGNDVRDARAKLKDVGQTVADIREAAVYVQAVGNLVGASKTLIEQERKAFGLDDVESEKAAYADMLRSIGKAES
jgi:hypothetical protein